jgi:hypothetical protein
MLRYGARIDDKEAVMAARDALWKVTFPSSLSQVCAATSLASQKESRAYAALIYLALKGEIAIDIDQPLSSATPVISHAR